MAIDEEVIGLNKKIVELEVQLDRLIKDKLNLTEEVMGLKAKYLKVKKSLDSEKQKWVGEEDRWAEIGMKKRKLEIDLEAAASKQKDGDEAVAKLKEAQAYVEALKRSLEERDGRIQELEMEEKNSELIRNALEEEKKRYSQLEEENRKLEIATKKTQQGNEVNVKHLESLLEERNNLELVWKLCGLETAKERMKAQRGKIDQAQSCSDVNEALEAEKTRKDELKGNIVENERDQMATQVSNLRKALEAEKRRVEGSQRAKKTLQANAAKLIRELKAEVDTISKEKMVVETQKRGFEELSSKKVKALLDKIEALMKDKRELENTCRANMDKDAEIARILKEKTDMAKMMSEMEEAIKMFYRENEALEAQIKELEKELKAEKLKLVLKMERDVE